MVKRIRRNIRIEEGVDMLVRELAKEKELVAQLYIGH